jgi:hypothetical protein
MSTFMLENATPNSPCKCLSINLLLSFDLECSILLVANECRCFGTMIKCSSVSVKLMELFRGR